MVELYLYLPTVRIEVEKKGMPKKTIVIYRMIYRKFNKL